MPRVQMRRGISPVYGVTIPGCHGTFAVSIEGYRCAKIVGLTERTGGRNCTREHRLDEIRDVGRMWLPTLA